MPISGYFDTRRDRALITAGGHFLCGGHLSAVPVTDRSQDPRYCQQCYDFLLKEAALLPETKGPKWVPKKPKIEALKSIPVPGQPSGIMHPTNQPENHRVRNSPPDPDNPALKRGPKFRELPEDLIIQWASAGAGSKKIAMRLKRELGIEVDHTVILRRLQRVMI